MKFVFSLLFAALLAFVAWPYYTIYKIDDALGYEDPEALAPLVDLDAVRAGAKHQFDAGVQAATGRAQEGSLLAMVQDGLRDLSGEAVDQLIDLRWVQTTLQAAARNTIDQPPYYFMRGIDYAFFDGLDSFLIRLGEIDRNPTHVRLKLRGGNWHITGIYH